MKTKQQKRAEFIASLEDTKVSKCILSWDDYATADIESQYKGVELRGCESTLDDNGIETGIEVIHPGCGRRPDFYSVYLVCHDGTVECFADFETYGAAVTAEQTINEIEGWPSEVDLYGADVVDQLSGWGDEHDDEEKPE